MAKTKLTGSERRWLTNVSEVIYANPFSDKKISGELKLVNFPPHETYTERYGKIIEEVSQGVSKLITAGKGDIRQFEGNDRILVESAFLLYVYNQIFILFDPLIETQIAEGDRPCKVPFADETLSMLTRLGFTTEEAVHYFSVFFQMRRAYYFVLRSIVGCSSCMGALRESLWNNVATIDIGLYIRELWNRMEDYSTILLGKTGTGKGISARAIGQSAYIPYDKNKGCFTESFTSAFVSLNLLQFPEQLIESELFGYKKGAFTGAVSDYDGALARCSRHGAVFLDEIGEVPIPVQIKLLQVLEDRVYTPVGSHEKKRFPGRIIAATNRPMDELRSEKLFRDDFYYRLCSDVIIVPPLRQRIREDPAELDDLVNHMVNRIVGEHSEELAGNVLKEIREQVPSDYAWPGNVRELEHPSDYAWPGNVRELEQCIRRILLKRKYEIDKAHIDPGDIEGRLIAAVKEGSMDAQTLLSNYCRFLYNKCESYEAVARSTELDRRTVKKYIDPLYKNSGTS
jgi:transcriptional regulator with AAA-type ATPase domain